MDEGRGGGGRAREKVVEREEFGPVMNWERREIARVEVERRVRA